MVRCGIFLFFLSMILSCSGFSKQKIDSLKFNMETKPKLYIDGDYFSFDYIRREVNFVNYVRERSLADIYLLITRRNTGSRGQQYTLVFNGKRKFNGIIDTLKFNTLEQEADEKRREKFINTLKRGLVQFVNHTSIGDDLIIYYEPDSSKLEIGEDKWDSWVFNLYLRGKINGEKNDKSYHYNASIKADRITESWKIRLASFIDFDEDDYNYENEKIRSISLDRQISAFIVKSKSEHISVGSYTAISSATYNNLKRRITLQPAFEYDLFPYEESSYRELFLQYKLGFNYNWYYEPTIFDKTKENIITHELDVRLRIKQYWGNISSSFEISNFINDLSKYRINVDFWISLNLIAGFSLNTGGGFSKINDQITISKANLSLEDLLLQKRELETNYNYYFEMGFSYTFGSIYNNIVNSRFDD